MGVAIFVTVTRDGDVNDVRFDRLDRFVAQSEFFHDTRFEVFGDDIEMGDEFLDQANAVGVLEIDADALFIAIIEQKETTFAIMNRTRKSKGVACIRRLDFHHLGAHVSHECRGKRSCDDLSEIQNTRFIENTGRQPGCVLAHYCPPTDFSCICPTENTWHSTGAISTPAKCNMDRRIDHRT